MSMLEQIIIEKEYEISQLVTIPDRASTQLNKRSFVSQLKKNQVNLICEIKPKSPTQGALLSPNNIQGHITAYNNHAAAISVLTDYKFFGGGYELLSQVKNSTTLPLLQKDFVLNQKQIDRGYSCGASAVLLIVKILNAPKLRQLIKYANNLDMTPVVEINTRDELRVAINSGAEVILINNRNLDTLKVDLNTTKVLAPLIPDDTISISASGYSKIEEIDAVKNLVNAFLVGTTLMKCENPNSYLERFLCKSTVSL